MRPSLCLILSLLCVASAAAAAAPLSYASSQTNASPPPRASPLRTPSALAPDVVSTGRFAIWQCDGQWMPVAEIGAGVNSGTAGQAPKLSSGESNFFWAGARAALADLSEHAFDTAAYLARLHAPDNGFSDTYRTDMPGLNSPRSSAKARVRGAGDKHSLHAR